MGSLLWLSCRDWRFRVIDLWPTVEISAFPPTTFPQRTGEVRTSKLRSTSDLFSLSFGRMNTSLVWKDRMMREVRTPGEAPPTKNCSFPNLDEEGNGLGVGVKQWDLWECRRNGESEMDFREPWEVRDIDRTGNLKIKLRCKRSWVESGLTTEQLQLQVKRLRYALTG